MRLGLAAAAVMWIVGGVFAQGGLQTLQGWATRDAVSSTLEDRGAFGRADRGDFDADGQTDAVLLEGDRALVLFNPGATFAMVPLAGQWNGACALRGATDRIALSSVSGIHVLAFDATANAFVAQPVLSGVWAGARELRAFDSNGDGSLELAAITADRSNVLVASEIGGLWSCVASIGVSGAARDVVALQWDADSSLEIAVLSDCGVYIYDEGVLVRAWSSLVAPGAIARIAQSGQSTDRLAWISAYSPPLKQWLRTLSPNGSYQQIDLGDLGAYAATGEDFDGDGDSDLLIAPLNGEALLWLENLRGPSNPSGPTFSVSTSSARVFELGGVLQGGANMLEGAWPAVADFDADGDLDFVIGLETSREVMTRLGDWQDDVLRRFELLGAYYDTTAMNVELTLGPPQAPAFSETHWLVDVWRAPDATSPLAPIASATFEVAAQGALLTVPLDENQLVFEAVYRIRVQPIQRNALGDVAARGCPTLLGFAVSPSGVALLEGEHGLEMSLEAGAVLPENLSARPTTSRARRVTSFAPGDRPTSAPQVN